MAEYGLQRFVRARYQRGSRTLEVEGLRFRDVAGAYGAFTYYRGTALQDWKLGPPPEQAAGGGAQVLFTRGVWLLRLSAPAGAAPTQAEARSLAATMPVGAVAAAELPDLPQSLPLDYRTPGSLRYSEGPAAFSASCAWLPAASVGFQYSAETALAAYNLPGRPPGAQLLVIAYPTPQIASARMDALARASGAAIRRSGTFVVLVHGLSAAQAQPLLHSVNYAADFIRVPPKFLGLEELPALIISVFLLCALVMGLSILLGVFAGGTHAMLERIWPERFRGGQRTALTRLRLDTHDAELGVGPLRGDRR